MVGADKRRSALVVSSQRRLEISIFSHDCECKLPPYYAPLPYYAVFKALFFNLGTRAIKGMNVGV